MKKVILDFLNKFGTKVKENEDSSYVELMMDNHICIEFDDVEYYVPENNSFYTEDDELTLHILSECYNLEHY